MTDIHITDGPFHYTFGGKDSAVLKRGAGLQPASNCAALFPRDNKPDFMASPNLMHGTDVAVIDDIANLPDLQVDALVTTLPNLAIAIRTADCAPVILYDTANRIIAVIHSGWPSTLGNIVANTFHVMRSKGAKPETTKVAIGPCLQHRNFEVENDLIAKFKEKYPDSGRFFTPHKEKQDKYLFAHVGLIVHQLQELGITDIRHDDICTLESSDKFYSWRNRHNDIAHDTERNASLIWME